MNGYLLDTHVLLWWLDDPTRLSDRAREIIASGQHALHVSAASVWEMAIKKSIGRLDMPGNLLAVLEESAISLLPITARHALAVADLPRHHDDPFDRMLIAQAQLEALTIVTRDPQVQRYGVRSEVA